jgi:hypothetical protein
MFKRVEETIYVFRGKAYLNEGDVDEVISEYILETYPEIVHSDFMPEESGEFEDLWDEVEELPLIRWVRVDA